MQLYDVVIFDKSTRKIDTIIGKKMPRFNGTGSGRNTADLRVQSGKERINDFYECVMIPAGNYNKGDVLPSDSCSSNS